MEVINALGRRKEAIARIYLSEGKGKITDYLAEQSDFVVRFQGGKNAGHTIISDFGKFALQNSRR